MTVNELYALAAEMGIEIHSVKCPASEAISMELDGIKYIGMDRKVFQCEARERLVLAHEMGHAATNAYYSTLENPVNIKRMEWRANKWTVERLIPKEELLSLFHDDVTVFELAEHFSVPEEMIKKALWIYFKKEIA